MKMAKILSTLLAVIMVASTLLMSGCNTTNSDEDAANSTSTRIRVRGMHPAFIPATEDMTIIINSIPEAPNKIEPGKKSHCTMPEIRAVRKIAQKRGLLP